MLHTFVSLAPRLCLGNLKSLCDDRSLSCPQAVSTPKRLCFTLVLEGSSAVHVIFHELLSSLRFKDAIPVSSVGVVFPVGKPTLRPGAVALQADPSPSVGVFSSLLEICAATPVCLG